MQDRAVLMSPSSPLLPVPGKAKTPPPTTTFPYPLPPHLGHHPWGSASPLDPPARWDEALAGMLVP